MRSRFTRYLIGAAAVLPLFYAVGTAHASSLTPTQVSAIIGLLQSFGADQTVVNNVLSALDSETSSSPLTCSSFTNVSYGNFDDNPGGPVSQLQTWLGIPPNTFGFGTYGRRTQAAWDVRCGNNPQPESVPQPIPPPQPVPTQPITICPKYELTACTNGMVPIQTGTDANGCSLPPECVPISCPRYELTACTNGMVLIQTGTDATGCWLPPKCVVPGASL